VRAIPKNGGPGKGEGFSSEVRKISNSRGEIRKEEREFPGPLLLGRKRVSSSFVVSTGGRERDLSSKKGGRPPTPQRGGRGRGHDRMGVNKERLGSPREGALTEAPPRFQKKMLLRQIAPKKNRTLETRPGRVSG